MKPRRIVLAVLLVAVVTAVVAAVVWGLLPLPHECDYCQDKHTYRTQDGFEHLCPMCKKPGR